MKIYIPFRWNEDSVEMRDDPANIYMAMVPHWRHIYWLLLLTTTDPDTKLLHLLQRKTVRRISLFLSLCSLLASEYLFKCNWMPTRQNRQSIRPKTVSSTIIKLMFLASLRFFFLVSNLIELTRQCWFTFTRAERILHASVVGNRKHF